MTLSLLIPCRLKSFIIRNVRKLNNKFFVFHILNPVIRKIENFFQRKMLMKENNLKVVIMKYFCRSTDSKWLILWAEIRQWRNLSLICWIEISQWLRRKKYVSELISCMFDKQWAVWYESQSKINSRGSSIFNSVECRSHFFDLIFIQIWMPDSIWSSQFGISDIHTSSYIDPS